RICASMTFRQQPVPHLRILTAARSPGAQTLVEQADLIECCAPESYVGSRTQAPDSSTQMLRAREECLIEHHWAVFPPEGRLAELKDVLGAGRELCGENETGHGDHLRIAKGRPDRTDPARVHDYVVVGEGDDGA